MRTAKRGVVAGEWVSSVVVLLVVMALVLAIVVPSVVQKTEPTCRGGKTRADLVALLQSCEEFQLVNGRYPMELEELVRPDETGAVYLKGGRVPLDSWRRPYVYVRHVDPGAVPVIYTLGRDGEPGGSGDDADVSTLDFED